MILSFLKEMLPNKTIIIMYYLLPKSILSDPEKYSGF